MKRGEVRLCRFALPDKRRPAVVLTRSASIGLLNSVTVAPITSTRRGVPTEVPVGPQHGLKHESAINLHNVVTLPQREVGALVCTLPSEVLEASCRALAFALGCDETLVL